MRSFWLRLRRKGRRLSGPWGWSEHDGSSRPKDRKSTRLNSTHRQISYAVFCLKKKTHIYSTPPLRRRGRALVPRRRATMVRASCHLFDDVEGPHYPALGGSSDRPASASVRSLT